MTNRSKQSELVSSTQLAADVAASFDLNEREAAVYVAALSSGARSVQAIAQAAKSERTGTYDVLERLSHRGLLRFNRVGKRTKVILESPQSVRSTLQAKLAEVDTVLPRLTSLFEAAVDNFSAKREVGEAVLGRVSALLASGGEPLRIIVGAMSLADIVTDDRAKIEALTPLFLAHETKVLVSSALSSTGQAWVEQLQRVLPCRRLPSPAIFASTQIVTVTSVVTVTIDNDELVGMEVTSPLFAQHEQTLFDALWRTAKQ